ncbi:MAG: hypothetical protein RIS44_1125 [Pseudomonadota bacterium]|jgi:hypothetical protein
MKLVVSVVLFAFGAFLPFTAVRAESLRCNGQIASEGDSRLSLLYKCGEPLLKDSYCAAVYAPRTGRPTHERFVVQPGVCVPIEEWLYDRGPGNLMATVRFRDGVVQTITYGHGPR